MRILGQRLGLWKCVVLIDFDGEMNLRIARKIGKRMRAMRFGPFGIPTRWVYLEPDGTTKGASYVKNWEWA